MSWQEKLRIAWRLSLGVWGAIEEISGIERLHLEESIKSVQSASSALQRVC